MKKLTILSIFSFLLVLFSLPTINATWCYQETANVSTACGGLSTGNYLYENAVASGILQWFDGNWDKGTQYFTEGTYFGYVNYSKPLNSNYFSVWQLKFGKFQGMNSTINITIPTDCWNQNLLQLRVGFARIGYPTGFEIYGQCWDGTQWIGNYNYLSDLSYPLMGYEEAMWWNIPIIVRKPRMSIL